MRYMEPETSWICEWVFTFLPGRWIGITVLPVKPHQLGIWLRKCAFCSLLRQNSYRFLAQLHKDHVRLSDNEVTIQECIFLYTVSSMCMTDEAQAQMNKWRNPNASLYINKIIFFRGERVLQTDWRPPVKTWFRGSLSSSPVPGVKMLGSFHGHSAGSRIVPKSHSGNTSSSIESCGSDLRHIERGRGHARAFHQQQTAVWGALSFTLTWSHRSWGCHSPPKSPCIAICISAVTFIFEQMVCMAFHDDPAENSYLQAGTHTTNTNILLYTYI